MNTENVSVVARLRKLLLDGHFARGERLVELAVADLLGVSRTPVRLALRALEQEGLLERAPKRGFVVRDFSEEDVLCALEVRGVLEGLAARRLAEQGMSEDVRARLAACLRDGAHMLAKGHLLHADVAVWSDINRRFHDAIVTATDSRPIADAIARNNHLPFASSDSIIIDSDALPNEYEKLRFAQLQHQLVVGALERREGARAEMLMREHAYIGVRYGELFGLDTDAALGARRHRE